MNDRKRLHRGDPARITPVRNFSKLYSKSDSANGSGPAKPVPPDTGRVARSENPLAEGVELAYSVIEKHIAEGRRAAEGFSTQPYTTHAPGDNLQVLVERMLRFQAEMLPLWIETLSTLVKVYPSQNGHAPDPATRPHANDAETDGCIDRSSLAPTRPGIGRTPSEFGISIPCSSGSERR